MFHVELAGLQNEEITVPVSILQPRQTKWLIRALFHLGEEVKQNEFNAFFFILWWSEQPEEGTKYTNSQYLQYKKDCDCS